MPSEISLIIRIENKFSSLAIIGAHVLFWQYSHIELDLLSQMSAIKKHYMRVWIDSCKSNTF